MIAMEIMIIKRLFQFSFQSEIFIKCLYWRRKKRQKKAWLHVVVDAQKEGFRLGK